MKELIFVQTSGFKVSTSIFTFLDKSAPSESDFLIYLAKFKESKLQKI